jgi:hypothetical protein
MNLVFPLMLLFSLLVAANDKLEIDVSWPVVSSWTETTIEIQRQTGIQKYYLHEQRRPRIYQWALEVEMAKGWCRTLKGRGYTFTDSAPVPDTHSLGCHISGRHSMDFDSSNPTIKKVGIKP